MKSAYYDAMPSKFEAAGNGSYIYRWDVKEEKVERHEASEGGEESEKVQYSCYEVVVWAPVSSNKILQAVLEAKFPDNREQKYINEYNAAILGVYTDEKAKEKVETYKAFLRERDAIKNQVDSDCAELNIK